MSKKSSVMDILETTVRVHRLDSETALGGWAERTALKALPIGDPDALCDFLRGELEHRNRELAAARWYEQN